MEDKEMQEYTEDKNLPDPVMRRFYKDFARRVLWLDTEVTDGFLEFGKFILQWNAEDADKPVEERVPIKLMFFSPGGSLYVNNAMVDIISMSKTPVYGYNMGMAFSAACFMFLACHKRFALPSSSFMLHKGNAAMEGDTINIENTAADYKRSVARLIDLVVTRTTIPKNVANKKMNSDWFITAQDAHEKYGFVDEILTDMEQVV